MTGAAPRRDNGLRAAAYDRLADVETHLVDGLLDRLRDEEVAAYSAPTPGRRGPYGETIPPLGPSDSVWVDSGQRDRARRIVDGYLAEVADEIAWAGIVADFDRDPGGDPDDRLPRWPASEDVDDDEDKTDPAPDLPGPSVGFGELRAKAEPAPVRDEDHFEPPPPPPLPRVETATRFAWAGALGGPVMLLLATLAGLPLDGWVGGLSVAAFMAGFVTLIARMKDRAPTDSGPDDGAVV